MKTFLSLLALSLLVISSFAQDLVQWRGPQRDGVYLESGLLKQWPADGPKMLWSYDQLGDGHSSATVTDDRIFTSGMTGDKGYVFALDHSGNLLWKTEYGKEWTENWNGLHSTPLYYKGKLYILSAFGKLVCLNANNGTINWTVDLFTDYDGQNIEWGITENLLIDNDLLYCTPGGKTTNVIALNPKNGELIWKSSAKGEKSAYCSPLIIQVSGRKLLVTHTANSIIGLDAANGELLWSFEHKNRYAVHPNTPIYNNGYLLCFSGYGQGAVMLKLSQDGNSVSEVWRNKKIDNQMGGLVLYDGKIYGSGHNSRSWHCVDWKTGETLYSNKIAGNGNIIMADGMLYGYGDNGEVVLIKPTDNGFEEVNSFKVKKGSNQHWAHLVIHNKKLYLRRGTSLMVYSIANN
ncbi:MAG: PQQ-like beta-propeller repeat protein [Tenuifilaceae bacterium]|jgi:outer membrane protein assembly factor BamB|nr:PQQ-like beta-propeller repeat protein [Tenuifilaceae bacterium]